MPRPLWDEGEAAARVEEEFPGAVLGKCGFRGEAAILVDPDRLLDVLAFLRDDPGCGFDFLTDLTAVHWPGEAKPIEVVYHLYSMPRGVRFRVKAAFADGAPVLSAVEIWPGANWMERECFDMFGIVFEGHPDLSRILLPDGFEGWPLRKEFPLKC